jgi:hypothetical protein
MELGYCVILIEQVYHSTMEDEIHIRRGESDA